MKHHGVFFSKDDNHDGARAMAVYVATLEKENVAYLIEDLGHGWMVEVTGY
jgi:hypothetical protein